MDALEIISSYFPPDTLRGVLAIGKRERVTNIRLRAGQPVCIQWPGGDAGVGKSLTAKEITQIVSAMLEHSLYAWEDELGEGYFTLPGGSRAGVTGRFVRESGRVRLAAIGSVCIRVARAVENCALELVDLLMSGRVAHAPDAGMNGYDANEARPPSVCSDAILPISESKGVSTLAAGASGKRETAHMAGTLVIGPPGSGKTTLLRDAARLLSEKQLNVAISDERGEIAACRSGVPSCDVGTRADVADGIPKALAMPRMLRAMAPDVLITDEIGAPEDAFAIRDAARMGVCVLASAHSDSLRQALARPTLRKLLLEGAFQRAYILGRDPGDTREKWVLSRNWERIQ